MKRVIVQFRELCITVPEFGDAPVKKSKTRRDQKQGYPAGYQEVEDLKVRQNGEMLAVLDEEQAMEKQRDQQLQLVTDSKQRKQVEKLFELERTKAHARIQDLAE